MILLLQTLASKHMESASKLTSFQGQRIYQKSYDALREIDHCMFEARMDMHIR